jgi:hypothetical protein
MVGKPLRVKYALSRGIIFVCVYVYIELNSWVQFLNKNLTYRIRDETEKIVNTQGRKIVLRT